MQMALLPPWLVVIWVVLLCGVALLHGSHLRHARGAVRWWHATHITMAAGMIAMYVTPHSMTFTLVTAVMFAALALAIAPVIFVRRHQPVWRSVWGAAAADSLAMVYMSFAMAAMTPLLVPATYLAIAYLCIEASWWLSGLRGTTRALVPTTAGTTSYPIGAVATANEPDLTLVVRVTLGVMSASMAWMLLSVAIMQTSM